MLARVSENRFCGGMKMPFDRTLLVAWLKKIISGILVFILPMSISPVRSDNGGDRGYGLEPPFDSTVSTAFDIIQRSDVSSFSCLNYMGRLERQVWDKRVDGEPEINTFLFHAHYSDGTYIKIVLNPEFENVESARLEAKRYTHAIGQLPVILRQGIRYFGIHKGNKGFHAGNEQIIVYSDRASIRIKDDHLEESLFHEAVHASWDEELRLSREWRQAQKIDGRFLTKYAENSPEREDLAETALFAFALLHHPGRIPPVDTQVIESTVPERIEFIGNLFLTDQPVLAAVAANPECTQGRRSVDTPEKSVGTQPVPRVE